MERNRKKIRVVFWCVYLLIAFALGICKPAFGLSDRLTQILFEILCVGMIVAWFVINQLWYREFCRTVSALSPLLTEEKNYDRYIAENEALLVGKKSEHIKCLLCMNLCIAYCEKRDYVQAKQQLLTISPNKLHGIQRVAYLADLAYVSFYLGQDDEALAAMAQNRKGLRNFAQTPTLGALVAVLRIFELLARDKKANARLALEEAQLRWPEAKNADDFEALTQRLTEKKENHLARGDAEKILT